jgi:hypothetical protein
MISVKCLLELVAGTMPPIKILGSCTLLHRITRENCDLQNVKPRFLIEGSSQAVRVDVVLNLTIAQFAQPDWILMPGICEFIKNSIRTIVRDFISSICAVSLPQAPLT